MEIEMENREIVTNVMSEDSKNIIDNILSKNEEILENNFIGYVNVSNIQNAQEAADMAVSAISSANIGTGQQQQWPNIPGNSWINTNPIPTTYPPNNPYPNTWTSQTITYTPYDLESEEEVDLKKKVITELLEEIKGSIEELDEKIKGLTNLIMKDPEKTDVLSIPLNNCLGKKAAYNDIVKMLESRLPLDENEENN